MNNLFEMPAAIKQAKESQGGMFFLWEILVFIGVFLVSIIIESSHGVFDTVRTSGINCRCSIW